MKKFIFIANVIAPLVLVPTVLAGYLHSHTPAAEKSAGRETAKDVTNGMEEGISLKLVKSF